jgi:hypothetical protein
VRSRTSIGLLTRASPARRLLAKTFGVVQPLPDEGGPARPVAVILLVAAPSLPIYAFSFLPIRLIRVTCHAVASAQADPRLNLLSPISPS